MTHYHNEDVSFSKNSFNCLFENGTLSFTVWSFFLSLFEIFALTGDKLNEHKNIAHDVVQYIEDSNNSIGGENATELLDYTEDYHKLLVNYYKANKLHINEELQVEAF